MDDVKARKLREAAEILGVSVEKLVLGAHDAISAMQEEQEEADNFVRPAPVVYPNIRFRPYKFQEYPKAMYRGQIRDLEEPYAIVENGKVVPAVRTIRDKFTYDHQNVRNAVEERVALGGGWFLTLDEAKEAALARQKGEIGEVRRLKPEEKPLAPGETRDAGADDWSGGEEVAQPKPRGRRGRAA